MIKLYAGIWVKVEARVVIKEFDCIIRLTPYQFSWWMVGEREREWERDPSTDPGSSGIKLSHGLYSETTYSWESVWINRNLSPASGPAFYPPGRRTTHAWWMEFAPRGRRNCFLIIFIKHSYRRSISLPSIYISRLSENHLADLLFPLGGRN